MAIQFTERFMFHEPLKPQHVAAAREILSATALCVLFLIGFIDFFALTPPGRYILDKVNFIDIKKTDLAAGLKSFQEKFYGKRFELFALTIGAGILLLAVARAANICMTYDEAATYINYVQRDFIKGMLSRQFLNNHILNSLLIRFSCFVSQTQYDEFFIRLPNLIFYGAYILFAFRIARSTDHPYIIFILCVSNYYLNEFSSLARGYGMAAACMLGTLYYFDLLRNDIHNKKILHLFFLWASLAALANGITLYTLCGLLLLMVILYRIHIVKLSLCPYFLILAFSAAFVMIMGRQGRPVASTHDFFDSITIAPFGTFSLNTYAVTLGVSVLFQVLVIFNLFKSRFRNDYALIYIIFLGVSLLSNALFHRGYPISREMIPFYPVVVYIIKDAIDFCKETRVKKTGLCILGIVLCLQFVLQINIRYIPEWGNDYRIRREVLEYINRKGRESAAYRQFIDNYGNPAADFYDQKYDLFLED
ncbi:MAG: hypothetical protein LBP60_04695 [Spirochaetaceae bacterium]|nr:hypothetical protein [Spirochaetaceae bacterium]